MRACTLLTTAEQMTNRLGALTTAAQVRALYSFFKRLLYMP
jgi:hypothetical protein